MYQARSDVTMLRVSLPTPPSYNLSEMEADAGLIGGRVSEPPWENPP